MNGIKISVVVPVYNIENYIEKTVESIINQTYHYLEIILVNDGSTDHSGNIVDRIAEKDNRIKVIHQANSGVTSARIAGIKAATGEWIGFVDGDDYIEPDMYEVLLKNALDYDADISHCGYQMVFPSRVDYYYNTKKNVVQNRETGLYDLLSGDFIEPALVNKIYKSQIVKSVIESDLIDTSIKINEDLLMNYYFFKFSNKSIYYDICPYHYVLRKNSAATSKVNRNKLYDPICVQKKMLEDVKGNDKLTSIIYNRLVSMYIYGASMKISTSEQYVNDFIEMCLNELKKIKPYALNENNSKFSKFKYRLCVFSPTFYRCFHGVYSKLRGTDKKFEVR